MDVFGPGSRGLTFDNARFDSSKTTTYAGLDHTHQLQSRRGLEMCCECDVRESAASTNVQQPRI
jgi:hypothetical protein